VLLLWGQNIKKIEIKNRDKKETIETCMNHLVVHTPGRWKSSCSVVSVLFAGRAITKIHCPDCVWTHICPHRPFQVFDPGVFEPLAYASGSNAPGQVKGQGLV
jgi:hypothetical protein